MSTGFLIDMDGVIYRGSELIPGARQFIVKLLDEDVPFLFLTNNSQRSRRDAEPLWHCWKKQLVLRLSVSENQAL